MKSAIRRYCCEGNDVLSAKDMRTALSERPVRGTIASVFLVNETQKTLKVNKMDGFSKYHNFIFELNGIRVWRADGVGKGRVIPYQDTIVRPQGPTDLVVDVHFFSVKEARIHKATSRDEEQSSDLFFSWDWMSDGVQEIQWPWESSWSWRTPSRTQGLRNGVYDKLRRGWAEKFHTVENNEEIGSALVAHTDEHRHKNEASASCSDLQLGWAFNYTSRAVKLCGLRMRLNST